MRYDIQDKKVLVYDFGSYLEVAERLSRDYAVVYYYCPYVINGYPDHQSAVIGMNVPGVVKVKEWASVIQEVDLVYFPDSHESFLQNYFRSIGIPVFGSGFACNLEHDRRLLNETLNKLGLPVSAYYSPTGLDELEQLLLQKKELFVKSSLRGDMETWRHTDPRLSKRELKRMRHEMGLYEKKEKYIVQEPIDGIAEVGIDPFCIDGDFSDVCTAGVEIKDAGYLCKMTYYKTLPPQIKDITDKLGPIFRDCGYRGHYSNEIIISKDKRGFLIDNTCFSMDTQVLTQSGWKYFYELLSTDSVCTLNPYNKNIEYHVPYDYISYYFEGDMVLITNDKKGIECLVTPNHSVWRTDRNGNGLFEERADSLTGKGYIPRSGVWPAQDTEYFELPMYKHEWDFMGQWGNVICKRSKVMSAMKIKMDDWVAFLAWYLAEGALGGPKNSKGVRNSLIITQEKYKNELSSVLNKLGIKYKFNGKKSFQINSTQLCNYLKTFGLCDKKYIPDYIKNCSARQIRIFLDNYLLADGSIRDNTYYTTSKVMADDLQELMLKSGSVCNIRVHKSKGSKTTGFDKNYIRNHDMYILQEKRIKNRLWFEATGRKDRYIKKERYSGLVYDVTVKNHILYVRRNGKPFFSGNCRNGQPPSSIMMELYSNYSEIVWEVANGIYPNIQYEYPWAVQLIIKSDMAENEPSPVIIPDEVKKFVKIKNLTIDEDGTSYYSPFGMKMREIGSVVGLGKTIDEAEKNAKTVSESIEGMDISVNIDSIDRAKKSLSKLSKAGINFI